MTYVLFQAAVLVLDETQTSFKYIFFSKKKNYLIGSIKACIAGLHGRLLYYFKAILQMLAICHTPSNLYARM